MQNTLQTFDEQQKLTHSTDFLIGIDEAGRGPLAGPVVACACYIPPTEIELLAEVNDSKKLTSKKRDKIFEVLTHSKILYGVGVASAQEIDDLNILQATFLAMRRAAAPLLTHTNAIALIDGPYTVPQLAFKQKAVVDGDALSLSIAAASIIAKVTRDRYMERLDLLYPGYGFAGHKGYGTAAHLKALRELGPCPEHRKTFAPVQKLISPSLF